MGYNVKYICVCVCIIFLHYSFLSFLVDLCDLMRRCRSESMSLFILYNSATTSNYHLPFSPFSLLKKTLFSFVYLFSALKLKQEANGGLEVVSNSALCFFCSYPPSAT